MATIHCKVTLRGIIPAALETRNVFYWDVDDTAVIDSVTLAAHFNDMFTGFLGNFPSTYYFYGADVAPYALPEPHPWGVGTFYPFTINGTGAGDILPWQTAAIMVGKTTVKRVIARKFVGPLIENSQSNSTLMGPSFAALQAVCAKWVNNYVDGAGKVWVPAVWGPTHGWNLIGSGFADSVLGTMRRRKPLVGI